MERDGALEEELRHSNARFMASMSRILERYNHPFEEDFLVSLDTLTYDTPEGPKRWGEVSRKDVKKWRKKILKHNSQRNQRNAEISKQQSSDFEDEHSTVHQESSENSDVDTSHTGGASGDIVSVRKKFEDIHLQNQTANDGHTQKMERVQVDLIVQGDERNIPKWITVTPPSSSKHHRLTSPVRKPFGGASGDIVSVRRKFEDIHLQNQTANDGHTQKMERVQVDLIVQGDERNIPKWITVTPPSSSKHHRLTSPVRKPFGGASGDIVSVRRKFEDFPLQNQTANDGHTQKMERVQVDLIVQGDERNIPKWITVTPPSSSKHHRLTSPVRKPFGGASSDIVSVRRKFEDIHLQNQTANDGHIQKMERVQVDLIVQGDERNIPKWITVTPPSSSKRHRLTSPVRKPFGSQAAVSRKKLELSNKCSSSKYLQLQHSDVPISSNIMASPRHQPCPELSTTSCDNILVEYQSADEGCSWSNATLAEFYPAMLEIFIKLMTKHSQRKVLKYMFGHLKSKRRHSRKLKLNVTVDKMRGFRPCKQKTAFCSIGSCRSEDNQNSIFGHESRESCCNNCLISNFSDLAPYASIDTNETKMDYSHSSLEQHLASGKGQKVCKHTAFPDVTDRTGETFLVEDELQATASPKNSEYAESEKFAYKRFSEPSFRTSTASSDSRGLDLVEESKTQKTDFCVGTSELCSSAYSYNGNRNHSVSIPITNCSPARSSNNVFIYPEKVIIERPTSFHHKVSSSSSWFMKQSPSKMPNKYEDAFEELYYKVCSEEFQKPLTLTTPPLNSQNFEEKGRLVKSNVSESRRSSKQCDIEFDRLYEKLCKESVPKFPGFQTASSFRKYEEIQMPETVNALVNSPVRTYSAISRVKRAGNFQNYLPCSPVKRLKLMPEGYFSSRKCQEIFHSKKGNFLTTSMDFLSTYSCSNSSFFADHNRHCQDSGAHDSSDKNFLGIPGTSLQEFGTAGAHSGWPGATENCSSVGNVRKNHQRVYRKLSYTDEKDQLWESLGQLPG